VAGGWRRLHNEELLNHFASPNITRVVKTKRMRWAGHVTGMGEMINAHENVIGNSEGKRPHGKPRHRWEEVWTGFIMLRIGTRGGLL
jgi:hypothetical protein